VNPGNRRAVILFETLLLSAGFIVGTLSRLGPSALVDDSALLAKALLTALVIQLSLFYNGFYDFRSVVVRQTMLLRLLAALVVANLLLAFLYWLVPELAVGRGVALLALLVDIVAFSAWRLYLGRRMRERPLHRVLILGDGELARNLVEMTRTRAHLGYIYLGFLDTCGEGDPSPSDERIGHYDTVSEAVRRTQATLVVVAMADRRGRLPMSELLDLKFSGVDIVEGVDLYEAFTEKIYVKGLNPSWMIFGDGFRRNDVRRLSKRLLDVAASSFGLLVAGIPMLLTALLVKLTSPGPVIYAQERVGEFGRIFTLYKFRSMRTDAESAGPQWAASSDPRITRFGNFIRTTRLDELPQLFNVLKGDMSLVGPRPERPFFVIKLQREVPFFRQRLFVPPGVTGLAQVKFRYAENAEDHVEKLQYDLAYIKNMSLFYDVQIILETVKVMLFRRGSR
jgi:sugar transferase (PEP-CTERM system associated)